MLLKQQNIFFGYRYTTQAQNQTILKLSSKFRGPNICGLVAWDAKHT